MERQASGRLGLLTALAAGLLPIAVFYAILGRELRNVPMADDYKVFLEFILNFKHLPHLGSKLSLLLSTQIFEYKLIFPEAIVAMEWALTGRVNFAFLIVLGYLCVLSLLWLFWLNFFRDQPAIARRLTLFLPVCYFLFSLAYADSVDFAEYSLQILTTPLFAFAAIHFCLRPGKTAVSAACVCALISCFSSANGFLIFPMGLLAFWVSRGWLALSVWIATFSLATAAYLFHYKPANMEASGYHTPLAQKMLFYFSLLGSTAENMSRRPVKGLAIVIGVLGFGIFLHACCTRFYRPQPFWCYTTAWCLLSAAMVTQGRSGLGISLSLSLHYKLFSVFLIIYCYVYAVYRFHASAIPQRRKQQLFAAALAAAVIFCMASDYFGYKFLVNRQQRVEQGLNQFVADPSHNVPVISLDGKPIPPQYPEFSRVILNRALADGIYALPPPARR